MRKPLNGFHPQPNAWQCGPYALKHALLALGIVADADALTHVSGATEDGADERDLARAAAHHGCTLRCDRYDTPHSARGAVSEALQAGTPVLLCVDQWSHWVTAAAADEAGVVVLDSRLVGVFQVQSWDTVLRRLAYRAGAGKTWYDLHPVVPAPGDGAPARLDRTRVAYLLDPAQRELGQQWGFYLSNLLPLHRRCSAQLEWTAPLGDALREAAAALMTEPLTRPVLRTHRRLTHAAFVADAHALQMGVDGRSGVAAVARTLRDTAAAA